MGYDMKCRPTVYKSFKYKAQNEAIWSAFFDVMREIYTAAHGDPTKWIYSPQCEAVYGLWKPDNRVNLYVEDYVTIKPINENTVNTWHGLKGHLQLICNALWYAKDWERKVFLLGSRVLCDGRKGVLGWVIPFYSGMEHNLEYVYVTKDGDLFSDSFDYMLVSGKPKLRPKALSFDELDALYKSAQSRVDWPIQEKIVASIVEPPVRMD